MSSNTLSASAIKERMKERDILLSDISQALDIGHCTVTHVIQGATTSYRVAKAIANALDLPVNQIFGDKYDHPSKRGRKDRSARKQQIKDALLSNQPVPLNSSMK